MFLLIWPLQNLLPFLPFLPSKSLAYTICPSTHFVPGATAIKIAVPPVLHMPIIVPSDEQISVPGDEQDTSVVPGGESGDPPAPDGVAAEDSVDVPTEGLGGSELAAGGLTKTVEVEK
jgi:hypothetical protein